MKINRWMMAGVLVCLSAVTSADPGHKHYYSHKGYHSGKPSSHEYWDGHCKVKRKYKKDGRYKEKRDCHPSHHRSYSHRHHDDRSYGIRLPAIVIDPVIRIGN